jgi:hypothetical protein
MPAVTVDIYEDWVQLHFPNDTDLQARLKELCGPGSWRFEGSTRSWWVIKSRLDLVQGLFRANGYAVTSNIKPPKKGRRAVPRSREKELGVEARKEARRAVSAQKTGRAAIEKELLEKMDVQIERRAKTLSNRVVKKLKEEFDRERTALESRIRALKRMLDEATNGRQGTHASPSSVPNPYVQVFREMPRNLRANYYRQSAMALHPDKGGDNRTMQLLNAAYEQFKGE